MEPRSEPAEWTPEEQLKEIERILEDVAGEVVGLITYGDWFPDAPKKVKDGLDKLKKAVEKYEQLVVNMRKEA